MRFYVNRPIKISIGAKTVRADPKVQQHFACVHSRQEMESTLISTVQALFKEGRQRLFIFFNSKRQCDETYSKLERSRIDGVELCKCHGDMEQPDREASIRDFKSRHTNVLLCTDVISRGINILDTTVIQYGFPDRDQADSMPRETYVIVLIYGICKFEIHRLGRAGRADATGACYTIFYERPVFDVWEILEDINQVGPAALAPDHVNLAELGNIPRDVPDWAKGKASNSVLPRMKAKSSHQRGGKSWAGKPVNVWWEEDQKT